MKGLNKITCCLLAALLMPSVGHTENEQYGANFNNADIRQFVEIVSQHLGKTILIDPSVQGTISVRSNDTFSQQEYYQFFLSILDLYGYSVITLDNGFLKVVRSANVKTSPGMIADSYRPGIGDELVTRIVPLENVPARDLAPLLRQMMDGGSVGNVVHYEPSNVLILTGRASTINKLIEVIKRVDVIGTEKQQIIHLEYASAEDLAEILNQLISESHGKSQMPALLSAKIVADKRTNSLIISGPEKARQRITSLLKTLDVEESEEGNTRVYYLKYAKATNLVEVLTGVSEKLKDEKGNARKPSSSSAMDNVAITADEQTNSLVITADQSVQEKLATVIARLDIRRAQVLVEAIIVEVQDGNGLNLGVQWANKNVGAQQFTNTGLPIFNAAQGVADYKKNGGITSANPAWDMFSAYNGMAAGFFNGDWGVLLTALASNNKNDILATPSIVTLDNKLASFNVGQDVPVLSGSQTTSGDNVFNTVERKTVGTKLKVTPQVNEGDAVLLEIEQEVSSVDSSSNSTLGPTFNTRTIQNAVLVKTGETVVLGGLLDDFSKEQVSKVPLLGDIPLVGQLFRYTSTERAKRNLMVFTMTRLSQADFEARLEAVFHQNTGESQQIAQDIDQSVDLLSLSEEMPANEDLLNEDSAAPVIRLINAILSEAIKETASDIHIETYEKTMSIRFRIDGVLRTILQPNKKLAALLISRIKVMARLDIAEKRIPQDGRISLRIGRRNIDVRVSTLPSIYGERAVLRLLDKNSLQLSLNNLGMTAADKQDLENLIQLPHGIILVTGPTGSGKSTTLYAILSALNTPGRNILTVEDPVEYELEGIGQTQVNTRVDMSFARGLRAILRQDPDVVMVGEIRDTETAQIAVQASLTGHLVLSTLHTNSASGAVTRLRDMGVESFLLSSSLAGIIAQRLVRRLCPQCRQFTPVSPQQAQMFTHHQLTVTTIGTPVGCPHCHQSGYLGRMAIHEMMVITPELRAAVHENVDEQTLERLVRQQHNALIKNGLHKVISGDTSWDEVMRVASVTLESEA
ncbi:TPA: type II secretion system ATPase GspE [Escherichia coli]|nr:type II secretion system ATPase GspE [Escherichia coli]